MTLAAFTAVILSISTIYQSVQNRELREQIQELKEEVKKTNDDNRKLQKQFQEAQQMIEVLETSSQTLAGSQDKPKPEPPSEKCAYLTFDDGPHANTDKILDILDTYGIKATFFVNGRESDADIATYKRIVDEGHIIANHTYSHAYQEIYASVDAFMNDIHQLEEMLLEKAEIAVPKIVRFPGGSNNLIAEPDVLQGIKDTLTSQGYRYFDWNVSGEDAVREGVTAKEIYDEVVRTTKGREEAVILLHSASIAEGTVEALPDILDYYLEQGYVFCTLDKEYAPDVVLALISKE